MLARTLERVSRAQKGPYALYKSLVSGADEDGTAVASRKPVHRASAVTARRASWSCCFAFASPAAWVAAAAAGAAAPAAPAKATPTAVAGGQAGRRSPRRERAQQAAPVAETACTQALAEASRLWAATNTAASSRATARGEMRASTAVWEATLAATACRRQSSGSSVAVAATLGRLLRQPSRASARRVARAWEAKRLAPVRAPYCAWRLLFYARGVADGCVAPWRALPSAAALRESYARVISADVPPFKLAQMMAQADDKSSVEYQRLTWDALRKSINGLVNKVSAVCV